MASDRITTRECVRGRVERLERPREDPVKAEARCTIVAGFEEINSPIDDRDTSAGESGDQSATVQWS